MSIAHARDIAPYSLRQKLQNKKFCVVLNGVAWSSVTHLIFSNPFAAFSATLPRYIDAHQARCIFGDICRKMFR